MRQSASTTGAQPLSHSGVVAVAVLVPLAALLLLGAALHMAVRRGLLARRPAREPGGAQGAQGAASDGEARLGKPAPASVHVRADAAG